MGVLRAYIKPFNDDGSYATDFIEVTNDVVFDSIRSINQSLDNNDYDIGIYRPTNFTVKMNNNEGRYSDVNNLESIFRFNRNNSIFKLVWAKTSRPLVAGQSIVDDIVESIVAPEVTLFTGLLNDESLAMDLTRQENNFRVLGRESIFSRVLVPYSSLTSGDDLSDIIYACLNQSEITDLLTLSAANITVGTDEVSDDVSELENLTVKEALDELLLITNSVLYIDGDDIIVSPRTATSDVQYYFYGQGSQAGIENIQEIKNIKNGVGRVFNYLVWGSTVSQDNSSISKYGIRKKEFDFTIVTNATKRENLMDPIVSEFGAAKQEFDLITSLDYGTIDLKMLDRASIDYPNVYLEQENPLPICGNFVCGSAIIPEGLFSFLIYDYDHYKILERKLDFVNGLATFHMREI